MSFAKFDKEYGKASTGQALGNMMSNYVKGQQVKTALQYENPNRAPNLLDLIKNPYFGLMVGQNPELIAKATSSVMGGQNPIAPAMGGGAVPLTPFPSQMASPSLTPAQNPATPSSGASSGVQMIKQLQQIGASNPMMYKLITSTLKAKGLKVSNNMDGFVDANDNPVDVNSLGL